MIQPAKEGRIRATLKDAQGSVQLGKGGTSRKQRGMRLGSPIWVLKGPF